MKTDPRRPKPKKSKSAAGKTQKPYQPFRFSETGKLEPSDQLWPALRLKSVPAPWFYRIPTELDLLATRLELPIETVAEMIDDRRIPLRRRHGWGKVVLIFDALDGVHADENATNAKKKSAEGSIKNKK